MIAQLYQYFLNTKRVFINSNEASEGGIFFAVGQLLADGRHKSCQYAIAALQAGANFAVVNDAQLYSQYPNYQSQLFLVENGEVALQQLATFHRQNLHIPIIGIAGSNGKTTTKELLKSILSTKYNCFATPSNLNNHIGVPLSVLQILPEHQIAIIEIGANHLKETAQLSEICKPTHGVVTNNGKDHLGEYGSVQNIKIANAELYDYLAYNGKIAFVNNDNYELVEYSSRVADKILYGQNTNFYAVANNGLFLSFELYVDNQKYNINTQLFGTYWLGVFTAAAVIGYHFGINIDKINECLSGYRPKNLRGEQRIWRNGLALLDCYNANPSSMKVFIEVCQQNTIPVGETKNLLILGEMLELGEFAKQEHSELLQQIHFNNFSFVVLVGASFLLEELPQAVNLLYFDSVALLKDWLDKQPYQNWNAFVKGSRANKLEQCFE